MWFIWIMVALSFMVCGLLLLEMKPRTAWMIIIGVLIGTAMIAFFPVASLMIIMMLVVVSFVVRFQNH